MCLGPQVQLTETIVDNSSMLEILESELGTCIEDEAEGQPTLWILLQSLTCLLETFLLFAQQILSQNLGFVDPNATEVDIDVGSRAYTIQQSPGLLRSDRAAGTTGAVLWKITPLIAQWLSSGDNFVWRTGYLRSDSTVVELGCGISGLIALALAPLVPSGVYVLTDQSYVMKLLRQNILLNQSHPRPGNSSGQKLRMRTLPFDWETDATASFNTILGRDGRIDLILACDCIYNEHLIPPFVNACALLCAFQSSALRKTGLLVAQQLRSDDVLQIWLREMMKTFLVFRAPVSALPEELRKGYAIHFAILR